MQLNGNALTVGGSNNLSSTFSGVIADGTGGAGSLTKAGTGILMLSGSNTYAGPTAINQGKLVVDGALPNSAVSVNSGGTLGGTGSLTSVTVYAGGNLAPGDSLGALTVSGGLILSAGAVMDYELDTPSTSSMIYAGSLTLNGQQFSDFNFVPSANFGPGSHDLIAFGSSGGSLGANTSGTIDGLPATLAVQGNDLVVNVVPEPLTMALLGAGVAGLIGWTWRQRLRKVKPWKKLPSIVMSLALLAALAGSVARMPAADVRPALVPWPRTLKPGEGTLPLTAESRIVCQDPTLRPLANILAEEIQLVCGLQLAVAPGKPRHGDIVLAIDPSLAKEAYRLDVADTASVAAGNYAAVALGTATLLQSLAVRGGEVGLPRMSLQDEPPAEFRGLMIDVARKYHSIESLKDLVELCRLYKVRYLQLHLTDDQAFTFPSRAYPKLNEKPQHGGKCYTIEMLRDLVAYADARGVTIIPEYEVPDIIVMSYEIRFYLPQDLVNDGYKVINASWTPLYVVNDKRRPPSEIYAWNLLQFKPFGAKAEDKGIVVPRSDKVIGAQLCAWEQPERLELPNERLRVPAMIERIWNPAAGRSYDDFERRLACSDLLLDLLHKFTVQAEGLCSFGSNHFQRELQLALTLSPAVKGKIRYTLDGTDPTAKSPASTGTIRLDKTTDFKAQAFDADNKPLGCLRSTKYERQQ